MQLVKERVLSPVAFKFSVQLIIDWSSSSLTVPNSATFRYGLKDCDEYPEESAKVCLLDHVTIIYLHSYGCHRILDFSCFIDRFSSDDRDIVDFFQQCLLQLFSYIIGMSELMVINRFSNQKAIKIPDATRNEGQAQAFATHIDQTSFAPSERSSLAWLDSVIIKPMNLSKAKLFLANKI